MPAAPIPLRELIRKFRALGFRGPFSGGRHQFMIRGALKVRIPNPHHRKDISAPLLNEILRQAGISDEEWESSSD
jgi:predicted RNA binding protein YcfA (HicA-like mRNA interferase family)